MMLCVHIFLFFFKQRRLQQLLQPQNRYIDKEKEQNKKEGDIKPKPSRLSNSKVR